MPVPEMLGGWTCFRLFRHLRQTVSVPCTETGSNSNCCPKTGTLRNCLRQRALKNCPPPPHSRVLCSGRYKNYTTGEGCVGSGLSRPVVPTWRFLTLWISMVSMEPTWPPEPLVSKRSCCMMTVSTSLADQIEERNTVALRQTNIYHEHRWLQCTVLSGWTVHRQPEVTYNIIMPYHVYQVINAQNTDCRLQCEKRGLLLTWEKYDIFQNEHTYSTYWVIHV
jgi:hypothetical protein